MSACLVVQDAWPLGIYHLVYIYIHIWYIYHLGDMLQAHGRGEVTWGHSLTVVLVVLQSDGTFPYRFGA